MARKSCQLFFAGPSFEDSSMGVVCNYGSGRTLRIEGGDCAPLGFGQHGGGDEGGCVQK